MSEPEFLEVDEVIALHARQLAAFGGSRGIRDGGLLESAVAQPKATFGGEYVHADLEDPPNGLFDAMIAIAERRLTKEDLADLLRKWSKPFP